MKKQKQGTLLEQEVQSYCAIIVLCNRAVQSHCAIVLCNRTVQSYLAIVLCNRVARLLCVVARLFCCSRRYDHFLSGRIVELVAREMLLFVCRTTYVSPLTPYTSSPFSSLGQNTPHPCPIFEKQPRLAKSAGAGISAGGPWW